MRAQTRFFVLLHSEIEIPDGIRLPAGVDPGELRTYRDALVARLRRAAAPPGTR
jgi:hypothetical protein